MKIFEKIVAAEGQVFLGWRALLTDNAALGASARAVEPRMFHALLGRGPRVQDSDAFERKLYVIRKRFETEIAESGLDDHKYFYFSSLSCRTLVYKGMLTPSQVAVYFDDDLGDPLLASAICMFHSRFSTNTFPSWQLAHPYRMISHNGEINTLRGNINWMLAREALFSSRALRARRSREAQADHPRGALRHRLPGQCHRASGQVGLQPAARHDDAHSRGLGPSRDRCPRSRRTSISTTVA